MLAILFKDSINYIAFSVVIFAISVIFRVCYNICFVNLDACIFSDSFKFEFAREISLSFMLMISVISVTELTTTSPFLSRFWHFLAEEFKMFDPLHVIQSISLGPLQLSHDFSHS